MKVFLSSTYLDLIDHRKAIVQALRTMGEDVEHMEIFGALDKEPAKASLEIFAKMHHQDLKMALAVIKECEKAMELTSSKHNDA